MCSLLVSLRVSVALRPELVNEADLIWPFGRKDEEALLVKLVVLVFEVVEVLLVVEVIVVEAFSSIDVIERVLVREK